MLTPEANSSQELLQKEKEIALKAIRKRITALEKSLAHQEILLEEGRRYKEAENLAELVKANYHLLKKGVKELQVEDWTQENKLVTILLDPTCTPQKQLQRLYSKSQKLKKSVTPLEKHIATLKEILTKWHDASLQLPHIQTLDDLQTLKIALHLQPQTSKKIAPPKLPYHTFYSKKGVAILVGKNSESNHTLTFHVAHGSDLWFHAHSVSGAHVVIRKKKDEEIDPDAIQDAIQLALYHSKARQEITREQEVLMTERKYVSRTPSMPKGRVLVSKHSLLYAKLDLDRIQKIHAHTNKT